MPSRRPFAPLALFAALAVAGPAGAADQQKVGNEVPFDLAYCFVQPAAVEKPVNEAALSGLWVTSAPLVRECISDPRNYLAGKSGAFKVTLAVAEAGYTHVVESEGLTAAGKKCIEDAVGKVSPPIAPLPAGEKPVTYVAQVGELPAAERVRFGINEASDVAATMRLGLPSMCSCFEAFKNGPDPAPIEARLQVTRAPEKFKQPDGGVPKPVEVTFKQGPPAAVSSCMEQKLSGLAYPTTADQFIVPYLFLFTNGLAASADVAALPDPLKPRQLFDMTGQRSAVTQLALARKVAASLRYNELVKEYKAAAASKEKGAATKARNLLQDLKTTCKDLLKHDDSYIAAVESEAKLQSDLLATLGQLKAKDAAYGESEPEVQKSAALTQKQLAKAKEDRTIDEKACPKEHY